MPHDFCKSQQNNNTASLCATSHALSSTQDWFIVARMACEMSQPKIDMADVVVRVANRRLSTSFAFGVIHMAMWCDPLPPPQHHIATSPPHPPTPTRAQSELPKVRRCGGVGHGGAFQERDHAGYGEKHSAEHRIRKSPAAALVDVRWRTLATRRD